MRAEGPDADHLSALYYPLLGLRLPMTFSYHAATTLKLMDAYRIGYILEPWINLTPPIRGGVYTKTTHDPEEYASSSADTDQASDEDCFSVDSNAVSLESSASSIGSYEIPKIESDPVPDVEAEGLRRRRETEHKEAPMLSRLSPDAYIAHAIRGEIEDGIRENPSLDQETQRGINLKYQKLHQRVHDEGFYQCRYIEYAKEVTRYTLIFTAFLVALRTGWYMTSACLLGLFWVCHSTRFPWNHANRLLASNNVHST
jgi:delta8-fatty-acid desaturase